MIRTFIPAALLGLAACQPGGDTNAAREANAASPAPAQTPAPPAAPAAPDTAIPASMQGRWGLVPADCTSDRGDAKGLLTITADRLAFYESRATLRRAAEATGDRLVGDFDFAGEGQNWQLRLTLALEDGGRTLVRRDEGADAMPTPLRYSRCESTPATGR